MILFLNGCVVPRHYVSQLILIAYEVGVHVDIISCSCFQMTDDLVLTSRHVIGARLVRSVAETQSS